MKYPHTVVIPIMIKDSKKMPYRKKDYMILYKNNITVLEWSISPYIKMLGGLSVDFYPYVYSEVKKLFLL